jgi:lipoprotein-releasing system ATP-binding protein
MSETPLLLKAHGLKKSYTLGKRAIDVLRGIDLELQRGEFLAIQGASGAGKSTLLHILGGLDSPDEGEIWFDQQNLARLSASLLAHFRNRKVGFVFQAYHVLPELDALENVCLPSRMARLRPAQAEQRGRKLLDRVGLSQRVDHKPYELSGGEQQRVAVARALINEPDLLLADEPTGNLDSHTGQEIIDLLCSIREERGTTLVIATHDAKVAARAPRVVQLIDGVVKPFGSAEGG